MLPESQFCLSLCPEYSEGRRRNSWVNCALQALLTQALWRSHVFNDPLSVYLTQFIPFTCQSFPFPSSLGWGDCLPSQLINFSKQQRTFQTCLLSSFPSQDSTFRFLASCVWIWDWVSFLASVSKTKTRRSWETTSFHGHWFYCKAGRMVKWGMVLVSVIVSSRRVAGGKEKSNNWSVFLPGAP